MRSARRLDPSTYLRAFPLLFRNPQIVLGPLVAGLVEILLFKLLPGDTSGGFFASANAGIAGFIAQLIDFFGFAVALIVAQTAWRRGRAPFDDAWERAKTNAGGILLAAVGFNFVVYVAALVGAIIPLFGPIAMTLVAYFFFIYTVPAAAIGGIPGGAALQISLERARSAPLPTLVVTLLYIVVLGYGPGLIIAQLSPLLAGTASYGSTLSSLAVAAAKGLVSGYVALALAKTYDDISYTRY